jgi:hypothetical protein
MSEPSLLKVMTTIQSRLYHIELSLALDSLYREFENWKKGEQTPKELSSKIYEFQKNQARELFLKYERPSFADINIAQALVDNLISKPEISSELLRFLSPKIELLKSTKDA